MPILSQDVAADSTIEEGPDVLALLMRKVAHGTEARLSHKLMHHEQS